MMAEPGFSKDIGAVSSCKQLAGMIGEEAMSGTSNRTRQLEIIQMTGENVFAEFGPISRDLIEKVTSG